jgi:hypothetical protein
MLTLLHTKQFIVSMLEAHGFTNIEYDAIVATFQSRDIVHLQRKSWFITAIEYELQINLSM